MTPWAAIGSVILALTVQEPAQPAPTDALTVTAQRPTLSFNTQTVPRAHFELEAGAAISDVTASVPLFAKYGWTDRVEVELGIDAIRRVEIDEGDVTSIGDLTLGVRSRLGQTDGGTSFGAVGFVKLPTAKDGAGSGEPDLVGIGIVSIPLGRSTLDFNVWGSALGRGGGHAVGQIQGIATYYLPSAGNWGPYVEGAWQTTAGGEGDGAFVDVGVSFLASPAAVFDFAFGAGFSDGYPDWTATAGWTLLFR